MLIVLGIWLMAFVSAMEDHTPKKLTKPVANCYFPMPQGLDETESDIEPKIEPVKQKFRKLPEIKPDITKELVDDIKHDFMRDDVQSQELDISPKGSKRGRQILRDVGDDSTELSDTIKPLDEKHNSRKVKPALVRSQHSYVFPSRQPKSTPRNPLKIGDAMLESALSTPKKLSEVSIRVELEKYKETALELEQQRLKRLQRLPTQPPQLSPKQPIPVLQSIQDLLSETEKDTMILPLYDQYLLSKVFHTESILLTSPLAYLIKILYIGLIRTKEPSPSVYYLKENDSGLLLPLDVCRWLLYLWLMGPTKEDITRINSDKIIFNEAWDIISENQLLDYSQARPELYSDLLKNYLRSLQVPVIPEPFHELWLSFHDLFLDDSEENPWSDYRLILAIEELKDLLSSLPKSHSLLLGAVCQLCNAIATNHVKNRMTAENLAIILTPGLFQLSLPESNSNSPGRFEENCIHYQNLNTRLSKVIVFLIHYYESIFSDMKKLWSNDTLGKSQRQSEKRNIRKSQDRPKNSVDHEAVEPPRSPARSNKKFHLNFENVRAKQTDNEMVGSRSEIRRNKNMQNDRLERKENSAVIDPLDDITFSGLDYPSKNSSGHLASAPVISGPNSSKKQSTSRPSSRQSSKEEKIAREESFKAYKKSIQSLDSPRPVSSPFEEYPMLRKSPKEANSPGHEHQEYKSHSRHTKISSSSGNSNELKSGESEEENPTKRSPKERSGPFSGFLPSSPKSRSKSRSVSSSPARVQLSNVTADQSQEKGEKSPLKNKKRTSSRAPVPQIEKTE